ncbi:hypothetical protein [Aliidiomarina maris]|uniref:Succinyl-diaminopimelate desuccinylase n=1 Tax=Aliidiomarina maris TaxID=531312 RepID=A0A327X4T3_9GAMM|nr:hypothetical protein [Aliidiomarina maris]MCL5050887.1 hypothetical protein [Bacillota bacterium]RAK01751.1 hypothetical protein B0I24_101378 [Aliidiomarina maris]
MIRLLFLIPLVLCLLWMLYLTARGYRIRDGKQGFVYILVISSVIAAFYTLMWWLT